MVNVNRPPSVFFDDWRECLRSHFLFVVKINDALTEITLREVLLGAGIPQAEIDEWYQLALQMREDEAQSAESFEE